MDLTVTTQTAALEPGLLDQACEAVPSLALAGQTRITPTHMKLLYTAHCALRKLIPMRFDKVVLHPWSFTNYSVNFLIYIAVFSHAFDLVAMVGKRQPVWPVAKSPDSIVKGLGVDTQPPRDQ